MIFDKTKNWSIYFKHPIFNKIFADLNNIKIDTPNGIYFKNEDYYFKVMSYITKENPSIIENHRKEVDIQIVLLGSEKIKLFSLENLEVERDYSEEDDCQFYNITKNNHSELILKPSFMAVFFTQDIHQPQFLVNNKQEELKKIVIKVNEKFFT
jgi:YhcH/YjgK/YiaL family protein